MKSTPSLTHTLITTILSAHNRTPTLTDKLSGKHTGGMTNVPLQVLYPTCGDALSNFWGLGGGVARY